MLQLRLFLRQGLHELPPTRSGRWNDGEAGDQIRRAEAGLLNTWAGKPVLPALLLLGLLALALSAGPPPVDARCTLPWC